MDVDVSSSPRWVVRGVVAALLLVLLVGAVATTVAHDPPEIQAGNITSPATGSTLVAIQGFHWQGEGNRKKPARLLSFDSVGNLSWAYDGSKRGANWFYDADPLDNGNVLAVNTIREDGVGKTLVYELDPDTKERVWQEKFNITDTHDVDVINGDELLVANMREWDGENETSNDRLFVYNRTRGEITWEWQFKNHYPESTDGGMSEDWSHVNDVDKIGPGRYMASPRNFDQVIVIDRETKDITLQLGEDDNYDVMKEQHNPAYLETEDGRPAILVADSENNRVVEYTCTERAGGECQWDRTWEVGTGQLNWPRDANRLPNGNTLITDSRNNRVLEVTPRGRIVWETFAPWAPFSAERVVHGNDGVTAPTMHDLGYQAAYSLKGSAGHTPGTDDGLTFPEWLRTSVAPLPIVGGAARDLADAWQAGAPWIRPVWMAPWALVYLAVGALVALLWGVGEAVYQRRRIVDGVRAAAAGAR
jgi:hypothetical protein